VVSKCAVLVSLEQDVATAVALNHTMGKLKRWSRIKQAL